MQPQKRMIILGLLALLAGMSPWLALLYSSNLESLMCGPVPWRDPVVSNPQYDAFAECTTALPGWYDLLPYLLLLLSSSQRTLSAGVRACHWHIPLPHSWAVLWPRDFYLHASQSS